MTSQQAHVDKAIIYNFPGSKKRHVVFAGDRVCGFVDHLDLDSKVGRPNSKKAKIAPIEISHLKVISEVRDDKGNSCYSPGRQAGFVQAMLGCIVFRHSNKESGRMSKLTPGNPVSDLRRVGTRDAFHVPCVLVQSKEPVKPRDKVRFIDDKCKIVRVCGNSEQPHGIVDPFITVMPNDKEAFWIFLMPGIVKGLVHSFQMDLPPSSLEAELEARRREDPNCTECYQIERGRVVRW